jgi:quinoprotein glucose dehydrogenase
MTRTILIASALLLSAAVAHAEDAQWPAYGGDDGGTRYSPAAQITPETIDDLVNVWTYSTGDLGRYDRTVLRRTKFQSTPILTDEALVVCTPFNNVIALDPETGGEKWRFDPKIPTEGVRPANRFNCRGVAQWIDSQAAAGAACARRIFAATNDYRLFALDAKTGVPCADFGSNGEVKIDPGMTLLWPGEFQITSAPVAVGSVVVVGSAIGDNARVDRKSVV